VSPQSPLPHYFKILPCKSLYEIPGICVNCGAPRSIEETLIVKLTNIEDKVKTKIEVVFPLCPECGMVMKKLSASDRTSAIVAAGLALLPAGYFLVLQILAHADFVPTALPALIIFGLFYYILAFLLKPLGRLLVRTDYREKYTAIKKSVQITPVDPKNIKIDFTQQDFAERFEILNLGPKVR